MELAREVERALKRGAFPLVLGGDCSVLLGSLLGARASGRCGLIHVDGHRDFFHPRNYDAQSRLGSVAGMDLALATGRGEPLLARWGVPGSQLVEDADVVQIGEREELEPDFAYADMDATKIMGINVRQALADGMAETARRTAAHIAARGLARVWLHVDVDVLADDVMPAVDSPGKPGLDYDQLVTLLVDLQRLTPVIGANITVFDPELDPDGRYARELAQALTRSFT